MRAVIAAKLNFNFENASMRNLLLDAYIQYCDPVTQEQELRDMATSGKFTGHAEKCVNKAQRYMCIRSLLRAKHDVQKLFDDEFATDYSAADELESHRYMASVPSQMAKASIWVQFLKKGMFKQQDFIAASACFYNTSDREQCLHYAELWLQNLEMIEAEHHIDYFKIYVM